MEVSKILHNMLESVHPLKVLKPLHLQMAPAKKMHYLLSRHSNQVLTSPKGDNHKDLCKLLVVIHVHVHDSSGLNGGLHIHSCLC